MDKRYEIVELQGRRWALCLTAKKAVKLAAKLEAEKGLKCQVKEIEGGNSNESDSSIRR